MTTHDLPQPVGRPQGGMKSDAARAAYWRMNYESAIGALADLIAEHSEQRAAVAEEIAQAIDAERIEFGDVWMDGDLVIDGRTFRLTKNIAVVINAIRDGDAAIARRVGGAV